MKKTTYLLLVITIVLGMLLAGCGALAGCGSQENNEGAAGSTESSTQASAQADTQPVTIDHRYASKEEGAKLLLGNEEYYDGFSRNDLAYRTQSQTGTMEEYKAFAKEQVLDFTEEQKEYLNQHLENIAQRMTEKGYQIPKTDQIVFISTTMKEECDVLAYTHGTQIYLDGATIDSYIGDSEKDQKIEYVLAHELFHCLTRCNPVFRADMYQLIHFTVQDEDFQIPPSVEEYFISNPDVEHHNAYATFEINGKKTDCFMAFITTKHFEKEGDRFFDSAAAALVPIDGTDTYYLPEDASNFDEILGKNTDYVVDPEECMADNFGFLIAYDKDGPEGKGYPNPEIIEGIRSYLQQEK